VRVIVAEDVLITREGVVHLLRTADVEVVAEAQNATELTELVERHAPDAVVVDIRMPPTNTDEGLVAARRIRERHPQVAVVVLSQYIEPAYALRLLEGGDERVGYLLKERVFHPAVLVDALRRVTEGEIVVDPTIVARIMGRRRVVDPLAELSPREREVLTLVAEGLSNKAVAERLYVTDRTVEAHMAQVFSKLGLEESPDQHRRVRAVLTLLRSMDQGDPD
jgi:serine/threonine-protein kinase